MIACLFSKVVTIFYGMLYPAYCSYKAVKTKDVKEYVNWMMYWIVFSVFSVFETFADTFIGLWLPFYYELKILFMIWLLSPTTRGGSVLYRQYVHPFFQRHEHEIEGYLAEFKIRTSNLLVQWGSKAFNYAVEAITRFVMRGKAGDLQLIQKVTRTFSYESFGQQDVNRNNYGQIDELDSSGGVFESSDMDQDHPEDRQMRVVRQRNRRGSSSSNVRHSTSFDEQVGRRMGGMSKPYSMMDLTEQNQMQPPKQRVARKKPEDPYGSLPRVKRTRKPIPK